jgi:hypothetical protein
LGIVQLVVSLGAIPAGLSMLFERDGSGIGMSVEVLSGSQFPDFFIPGLFLFFGNGVMNVAGAIFSFKKSKYAESLGLVLGIYLLIWMAVQLYYIGFIHYLQSLFILIGIVEILLIYLSSRQKLRR